MRSRVIWRRSATAIGAYVAAVLGFLTTVVATRELGLGDYAKFAAVIAASSFFQQLLDLTIEESLVKYGFRYSESERWGRLRRLFELALGFKLLGGFLAALILIALAPVAGSIWGGANGVLVPMLVASTISIAQAPEGVAAGAIILRGRYDVRGVFLAVSMGLRLAGLAIGCRYGVTGGVIGMAVAQVVATTAIGAAGLAAFRRFPKEPVEPLAEDRQGLRRFVISSTLASSLDSARATLGTSLLPVVAPIVQAGYFRNAQAPATGFAALSGPVRLVMLTEQTRDFEAGRHERVFGMLRRYIRGTSLLMVVAVPVLWWLMPFLIGLAYGHAFRVHATSAARLVLVVAALRLVWGWTKSFPVSIGRPGLRVAVQSIEIAVFVPLLLVFGAKWGATGAAGAMLVSTAVFCAVWSILLVWLGGGRRAAPEVAA
jgi:O-antigen/teichoic acid export membrane protein